MTRSRATPRTTSWLGGAGNDTLDGGPGTDTLDGGPGTDVGKNGEVIFNIP